MNAVHVGGSTTNDRIDGRKEALLKHEIINTVCMLLCVRQLLLPDTPIKSISLTLQQKHKSVK